MIETLRVLVVDDELGMRRGVERSLRNFTITLPTVQAEIRFDVALADSGESALEAIKASKPDILLLDHKLPGISGLEVLDKVAEMESDIMTIMITAYASLDTAVSAIKRGAFDFLAKPFTPDELKANVRKAAESLFLARQARKLAEEKRQIRFQFISVLAHELKSPLAAAEGYLKIMQERAAGNDMASYDRMIERSLVRLQGMRKLILDLLDLTRIESGQVKREYIGVNLCEIAGKSIETIMPAAQKRGITIELHADPQLQMSADPSEIEIIFNNLISNAVKYNRDNGRIDITISAKDGKVTIEVADTGIGMTEAETARLFADFVRIKNEKTKDILGSGLGLSIVRKLAMMYGGSASVKSTPDVGSTFTVVLNQHQQAENNDPQRDTSLAT